MVEANTTKAEALGSTSDAVLAPQIRISALRYYIHDSTDVFRFQLLGDLREGDVKELSGCWATAQSTFGKRKIILDLQGLRSTDDCGKEWLLTMVREGASYLPDEFFRTNLTAQPQPCSLSRKSSGFFHKVISGWRNPRNIPEGSPTQVP